MNEIGTETKWWRKRLFKLPVWAWIAVAVVVIAASGGAGGDGGSTAEESKVIPSAPGSDAVAQLTTPETTTAEIPQTDPPADSGLTKSQENALRSAESYLDFAGFSRQGLIDQLSSEYADQFPIDDATVAVDSMTVDWNAQAVRSAQSYLEIGGFSCQGLIDQLSSEYGDKYTVEQATFAATEVGLC